MVGFLLVFFIDKAGMVLLFLWGGSFMDGGWFFHVCGFI
jgi:hypothetical protein